jgi:UDP-N-acetyl-D-mannosaminuronate dehydrogenase
MNLINKIKNKTAKIAVIGLGYVGLILNVEKAKPDPTVAASPAHL